MRSRPMHAASSAREIPAEDIDGIDPIDPVDGVVDATDVIDVDAADADVARDAAAGVHVVDAIGEDREALQHAHAVLGEVQQKLRAQMSLFAWRGFIEPLRAGGLAVDARGTTLALLAPSSFLRDWVRDHYGADLVREATTALGRPVSLSFAVSLVPPEPMPEEPVVDEEPVASRAPALRAAAAGPASVAGAGRAQAPVARAASSSSARVTHLAPPEARAARLNPRYTFETFVTGPSNRIAFSAASSVAEHPGANYTPLFLFGGSGLGKTHLLHAIGNEVLSRHPHLRVATLSAEQWVNEYIAYAQEKRFDAFRKKWRDGCDVLLIDDIQFLGGKTGSQDEFFHTFNALYEAHKQIVVTSDRFPHEIAGLEDRLKTRLQWGLVADVRAPEMETRRTIVDKKAMDLGLALPVDVADFLATNLTTSVRELEGAMVRLSAWQHVTREPLSLADAREQLRGVMSARPAELTVARVIEVSAAYYGLRSKDLTGPSRQRQVTRARQIAMWLARHRLQMSLPEIGRAFGDRDHTTVLSSVRKIAELLSTDAGVQAVVARLEGSLF